RDVCLREPVMIAKGERAGHQPAGGRKVRKEAFRTRNACDSEDCLPGRHDDRLGRREPAWRLDRPRYAGRLLDFQHASHWFGRSRIVCIHEQRVRGSRAGELLAQTSRRNYAIGQVLIVYYQQIDIALEREMLKPIVQEMNGRAEPAFGKAPREIAIGADEYWN